MTDLLDGRNDQISRTEIDAVIARIEDLEDLLSVVEARQREVAGDGGGVPLDVVKLMVANVHPVAAWRAHRSLDQRALAAMAGVEPSVVEKIEAGREWDVRLYAKLATALNAPIAALVCDRL